MTASSFSLSAFTSHMETLQRQAEQALALCGYESLLISSGHAKTHFLDDTHYAFRTNPHFIRWVPFMHEAADCWLWIRPSTKPALYIHAPDDFWYQSTERPMEAWADLFDIALLTDLQAFLSSVPASATAVIAEDRYESLAETVGYNPEALLHTLHFDRAVKTPWEIECVFQANCRAVKGHKAAELGFLAGESERTLHGRYLQATEHLDHELPYNVIMALNENAATLHYQYKNAQPVAQSRTLLLDGGASYMGYAADITRTCSVPADRLPVEQQTAARVFSELISRVDALQLSIIERVKPGIEYVELHRLAHQYLIDELVVSGLLKARPSSSHTSEMISRTFFPHGLGHFLGIQTHDVGGWQQDRQGRIHPPPDAHPFLRLTRVLEEGMVLTVEPGLYFIPSLLAKLRDHPAASLVNWTLVEKLQPWGGIRVEDNIVITAKGARNLTREAFALNA